MTNTPRLWIPLLIVLLAGGSGVLWMGVRTYQDAPPLPRFTAPDGRVLVDEASILAGQAVFQKYALMQYGSMFGDGGGRGPDFTATALHEVYQGMVAHETTALRKRLGREPTQDEQEAVQIRVRRELHDNRYDDATKTLPLSAAGAAGVEAVRAWVRESFQGEGKRAFRPLRYIRDEQELQDLGSFFYWGSWVCAARRPGDEASYTHNWPFDPEAGNRPGRAILLWSVVGSMGLILGLGLVLYLQGKFKTLTAKESGPDTPLTTSEEIDARRPSPTQRATYKFFAVAVGLFLLQVLAGVLTIHDFVGLTRFFGFDLQALLPLTITRSWHIQVSVLWIATCWIAASIFALPRIAGKEPRRQLLLVNILFGMLATVVAGTLVGVLLGPKGLLGAGWRWFGNQGWEFVELGRAFQIVLFASLVLWSVIVFRGVKPALSGKSWFTIPHWLLYTTIGISVLFLSSFVASPRTNFVIADFWRWMVIHMWAECFFEVFTTVIVAWFLVSMGLVTRASAERTVYLAVLLFLGSGFLGIAHNFYWNAKPTATMAVGSVFSTLQVVPLILLMLDAWRFRRLPAERRRESNGRMDGKGRFGLQESFMFLMAVSFWNFLGAGVFGFIINLPIVNYYEHGTYLTVNHGHAALMGVYGNLSIAAVLFCARYILAPSAWNTRLLRVSFWSINIGLMAMVLLDTFPIGLVQLDVVLSSGLWQARSLDFIAGSTFQTFTWMRMLGGAIFLVGGVIPLTVFILRGLQRMKDVPETPASDDSKPLDAAPARASVEVPVR